MPEFAVVIGPIRGKGLWRGLSPKERALQRKDRIAILSRHEQAPDNRITMTVVCPRLVADSGERIK